PASEKPPHRAMLAEREYWMRTGSGFRRMEHLELEDAFGRRQRPSLCLALHLVARGADDPHEELHYYFLNEGRGVARHAGFYSVIGVPGSADIVGIGLNVDPTRRVVSHYDAVSVVHPNGIYAGLGHVSIKRAEKGQPLHV